jgi:serine/threonine protein kinase
MSDDVGRLIGTFRIEGLITNGSTGVVYKAVETSSHEPVALRVLHPRLVSDPSTRQRVLSHAQLVSTLQHPNVAHIEGYGESDGRIYIATELAPDGPVVSSALSAPSRSVQSYSLWQRLDLIRQAADGLQSAHQKNILHLDLNPKTLLLKQTAADFFLAKIVDFGLATALDHASSGASELPGSPAYLAPEQWNASEVDGRTDLYALGVVLYQVAVGTLPFGANAPASAMYNHLYVAPQRPCQVRPDLPAELEAVILRCLAKRPQDRFGSAAELSAALRNVIQQHESGAEPNAFPVVGSSALAVRPVSVPTAVPVSPMPPPIAARLEIVDAVPIPASDRRSFASRIPQFFVKDQRNAELYSGRIQSAGVTFGSAGDNVVIINSPEISAHHCRIDWDGNRITLTDLGSKTSTFLDEHRLLPQVPQEWPEGQRARIGPFWLEVRKAAEEDKKQIIDVFVDKAWTAMTLVPGKAAECRVILANHKTTVDHICVSVEGIPSEWVRGTGNEIALNPYDKQDVVLTVQIPKASSSVAGDYAVTIRANSVADPDNPGEAKVRWTVAPFDTSSLGVIPAKATGRKRVKYSVTLHNQGNRPVAYTMSASDDDRELSFLFRTDQNQESSPRVELKPGVQTTLRLSAEAAKSHWFGSARPRPFKIRSVPVDHEAQVHEAMFMQAPVIPTWALIVAPLVLAALFLIVPKIAKPNIKNISIEPETADTGEPITVSWKASRAKSIDIQPVKPGIMASDGSYVISSGLQQTTELVIVASNFFGSDQRTRTVQVRPPKPPDPAQIDLTISSAQIYKGGSVKVSWSVNSPVDRVNFSEQGDVPAKGEYRDTPQADHTYTINAVKGNAPPTLKSVMVKVLDVPPTPPPKPHIRVDKTVIRQGQAVQFTWDAPGAESVRIEAPTPTTLMGNSGQRQAILKGKGSYTFVVVSSAKGLESKSDPVIVNVQCSVIQTATRMCHETPLVQW